MLKSNVLKFYKTNVAVATALGITEAAVSQWDELIPVMAAHDLAKRSAGALRFDPTLYSESSPRVQKIAAAISASS